VRLPDFTIVGAPKCGTTSMYDYLRPHPQVFLPEAKEIHFYGQDLRWTRPRVSEAQWHNWYQDAPQHGRVGEVAVWYLLSRTAARELHAANPDMRIVAMLREPVEMMHSLHSQLLFSGDEDISDFATALDAEADRRAGRRLPSTHHQGLYAPPADCVFYRQVVDYATQLRRYYEVFPRSQVHVVLFDELRRDTPGTYRRLLEFLDVDPDFSPDFEVRNPNKVARSPRTQRLIQAARYGRVAGVLRGFPPFREAGRLAAAQLQAWNTRVEGRAAFDPTLRAALLEASRPGVLELQELIGRDLTGWLAPS
jgi:Sulfotransferase domain